MRSDLTTNLAIIASNKISMLTTVDLPDKVDFNNISKIQHFASSMEGIDCITDIDCIVDIDCITVAHTIGLDSVEDSYQHTCIDFKAGDILQSIRLNLEQSEFSSVLISDISSTQRSTQTYLVKSTVEFVFP